jgi:hypothetical protein
MPTKNLTKEQNTIRNILYGILAFTISVSFIVDFYTLIAPKYRYLLNISLIVIIGDVFYVGYKYNLINKSSTISAIIISAIITIFTLLVRKS